MSIDSLADGEEEDDDAIEEDRENSLTCLLRGPMTAGKPKGFYRKELFSQAQHSFAVCSVPFLAQVEAIAEAAVAAMMLSLLVWLLLQMLLSCLHSLCVSFVVSGENDFYSVAVSSGVTSIGRTTAPFIATAAAAAAALKTGAPGVKVDGDGGRNKGEISRFWKKRGEESINGYEIRIAVQSAKYRP